MFQRIKKDNKKSLSAGDLDKQSTELTPRQFLSYGSEDHLIAKCPNSREDNDKRQKKFHSSEKGNHV